MTPPRDGRAAIRTLHLCQGLAVGGLENVVLDLARAGRERGHDDRILLFDADRIDVDRDLDPGDVPVDFAPRRRGFDLGCVLRTARLLRRARPRVLHAHNDTAAVYAAAAARLCPAARRPRLVVTFHNLPVHATTRARWATRAACRRAHTVAAVSHDLATRLVSLGWAPSLAVAPAGVDVRRFAPLGTPRTGPGVHVGMLARMAAGKRPELVIAAVAALQREGHDIRLTLAGDGPLARTVDAALARLREARRVPRVADVPAFLRRLDVLALLSDHEGTPRSILEGMACGLPIVASDVGGIPEMVGHPPAARLVPNEVEPVAATIRDLMDPGLRAALGERARRHAVQHHALERSADWHDLVYAR